MLALHTPRHAPLSCPGVPNVLRVPARAEQLHRNMTDPARVNQKPSDIDKLKNRQKLNFHPIAEVNFKVRDKFFRKSLQRLVGAAKVELLSIVYCKLICDSCQ